MDSDDISLPKRLQKQVSFLEDNPAAGIVGGTMDIINETGKIYSKREYNLTDIEIRKQIFRYSPFCHPVVTIRKSVLEKS